MSNHFGKNSKRLLAVLLTLALVLGSTAVSFGEEGTAGAGGGAAGANESSPGTSDPGATAPAGTDYVIEDGEIVPAGTDVPEGSAPGEGTEEPSVSAPADDTGTPAASAAEQDADSPAVSAKDGDKTADIAADIDRTKPLYTANPAEGRSEVRGLWIAFCDFKDLGLYNASKATYTANIRKVLNEAKKYGVNTVYFHVRAMDDAVWRSKHFPANEDMDSDASRSKSAYNTYSYDPLVIAIEEAHARGMELHAWMNPYRVTYSYFLDPADANSINRVLLAVDEVLALGVDGVHFDDYFYHAKTGYKRSTNYQAVNAKLSSTVYKAPAAATKRTNVNKMVKQVYNTVHHYEGKAFGISPAGNWENCMAAGADVKTWLSKSGYVDYLAPQIYWTDQWGSSGKTTMFSDRLALFQSKNTLDLPIYAGLALYRTGYAQSDDKGWGWSHTNLAKQLTKLRSAGYDGWILFSSADLTRSRCQTELKNFHFKLYPVSVKDYNYPTTLQEGKGLTIKGTITASKSKISAVQAGVVKKSTGKFVTGHYVIKSGLSVKTFDLNTVKTAPKFYSLAPGTYYYRVIIKDNYGVRKRVIDKKFTVKALFSASLSNATKPTTITKGKSFTIKGTIKCALKMTRVEIGIVSQKTGKWVYHYDKKISAKTFDIHKADSAMQFRKLAKGKYYYRIIVHTGKGSRRLLNRSFTVK